MSRTGNRARNTTTPRGAVPAQGVASSGDSPQPEPVDEPDITAIDAEPDTQSDDSDPVDPPDDQHTASPPVNTGLGLDEDPDTSLVVSLSLHMLSEHAVAGMLHLDEGALAGAHQLLHEATLAHASHDHRFRPQLALATAMLTPPRSEGDAAPPASSQ